MIAEEVSMEERMNLVKDYTLPPVTSGTRKCPETVTHMKEGFQSK